MIIYVARCLSVLLGFGGHMSLLWNNVKLLKGLIGRSPSTQNKGGKSDFKVNAETVRIIKNASCAPKRILNPEEAKVLYKLENWVEKRGVGERVFTQVPLRNYIKIEDDTALRLAGSKQPDFIVVNSAGLPVCVVEYQGGGHWSETALKSDRVKRLLLDHVRIPLVEIYPHERDSDHLIHEKLDAACGGS